MIAPNEFWLCMHELARAVYAEGSTDEERRKNILESLSQMPPMARKQVIAELVELLTFLPDLYPHVISQNALDDRDGKGRTVA